ncbi:ABC transporter permease [Actinomarinicola tropica]|uniref:ABC transporter permease n=1 Tax=Actinomarinicola tropica TaxID=2789776 RepID=A0A5Q2RH60_9ACTN|nr:ABC transporter permease [Actinomarinicola tropica]QGG94182.1 ABC transporter permease [Actinomarinicola tropica]
MTGLGVLVARRALVDYARRPLNLVLLVAVPVVLVFVWGGSLADLSALMGGTADPVQLEAATAGWAAAALAGLGGLFQITGARTADRRLAAASAHPAPVVAGRVAACLALAGLAAAGGLIALAVRTGINDPVRAVVGTVVVATIYVAIGVLVGSAVRSDMNGALLVTLAWILDVFLGPAFGGGTSALTRVFPLHFPQLLLTSQVTGHGGPVGDLAWSLLWAVGLGGFAVLRLLAVTATARRPVAGVPGRTARASDLRAAPAPIEAGAPAARSAPVAWRPRAGKPLGAAVRAGVRDYRRNRVLWALLVGVPAVFIGLAILVTVDTPGPVEVVEGGRRYTAMLSERRMHAATMVPVTAAFLAGLAGLFVATGTTDGDRRLVLAGLRTGHVLGARLAVIALATVVTTGAAVAVSGAWYPPRQWVVFAGANLLIAATYAMIGLVLGPLTGRLGGLYLVLLLAFIDVGLGQTVMLPGGAPAWGAYLPGRGASRMLIDGAFTGRFDQAEGLLLGAAWLAVSATVAAAVFWRRTGRAVAA